MTMRREKNAVYKVNISGHFLYIYVYKTCECNYVNLNITTERHMSIYVFTDALRFKSEHKYSISLHIELKKIFLVLVGPIENRLEN